MHSRSAVGLVMSVILITASFVTSQQAEAQVNAGRAEKKEVADIKWTKLYGEEYNYIPDEDLSGISGNSPNDVYAVGDDGKIIHFDGKKWSHLAKHTNEDLKAVWVNEEAVFAVGNNGTIIRNGSLEPNSPTKKNINAVWGTFQKDKINVFAVGNGGAIVHFNGEKWSPMDSPAKNDTINLNGVWGNHINNIYAVGDSGTILYYNGETWSQLNTSLCFLKEISLQAVWGNATNDVFIVGAAGTIIHYDGVQWYPMKSPTKNNLHDIQGTSSSDIYAVGDSGTVLHYNGEEWSSVKDSTKKFSREESSLLKPLSAFIKNENLKALWISSNPHIFIIGEGGIIVGGIYGGKYWIGGYIYDLINGNGLNGAQVLYQNPNGNWELLKTTINDSQGNPGMYQDISFAITDGATQTLKFLAADYKTEVRTITLLLGSMIPTKTYLLPHNSTYSIAGIITKTCQSYDCPIGAATVNLYKDNGDYTFSKLSETTNTDDKGWYSFQNLQQGLYKVEPTGTGCNPFTPSIVQIPQNSPPNAFDFIGTGTGICQCTESCPY